MKFDLNQNVFDEYTVKLLLHVTPNAKVESLPLSQLLMQLLLANNDKPASAEVKTKNYELLVKTFNAQDSATGIVDFTLAEISIIKGLADANCPTLVHGRLNAILEAPIGVNPS